MVGSTADVGPYVGHACVARYFVDTTAPVAGTITCAPGAGSCPTVLDGVIYADSITAFSVKPGGFGDPDSSLGLYLTSTIELSGAGWTRSQSCARPCDEHTVSLAGTGASSGSVVRIAVKTVNAAGLAAQGAWLSVTLDATPPVVPASTVTACTAGGKSTPTSAGFGSSAVTWWQPTAASVAFCWPAPGFVDAESTVRSLKWMLYEVNPNSGARTYRDAKTFATSESRALIAAGRVVADFASSTYGALLHGVWYQVQLVAIDGAEHEAGQWSVKFSYDRTPPDVTGALATLCPESGALHLAMRSAMKCDTWPASRLADVLRRDQAATDQLTVRWKGITDVESGVVWCALDVIDTTTDSVVRHEPSIPCAGTAQTYTISGLELEHTGIYTIHVVATNGAGLTSTVATNTVYIDTSGPAVATVSVYDEADMEMSSLRDDIDRRGWEGGHHGVPAHVLARPQMITCSWTGFAEDDATTIVGYQWAISTSTAAPYTADVMPWSSLTPETLVAATNVTVSELELNVVYRCLVVAVNSAGVLSSVTASNGFTFDETPPVNGVVTESIDHIARGWGSEHHHADADLTPDDTEIVVEWSFNDTEYGAVQKYEAGVGPCAEAETLTLLPMGTAINHTFSRTQAPDGSCDWESVTTSSACRLAHNATFCSIVRAQNTHGIWGARVSSNGIRVCTLGPVAGTVSDGTSSLYGEELDFTSASSVLLSWSGFRDECAPIESYEVLLQTPGTDDAWSARLHRRKSAVEDTLQSGYNGGLHSRQDLTSAGTVLPIGIEPHPWTAVTTEVTLLQSSASFTSLGVVVPGEGRYRARVCAVNVLRQRTCAYSDGFVAEYTPPSVPVVCVRIPGGTAKCDAGALSVREGVTMMWKGCDDDESGVGKFLWSISPSATPELSTAVFSEQDVDWRSEVAMPFAVTQSSAAIFVNVTCINGAGQSVSGTLGPLLFDDTPPEVPADVLSLVGANEDGGTSYVRNATVRIRVNSGIQDPESALQSVILLVHARGSRSPALERELLLISSSDGRREDSVSSERFVDFDVLAAAERHTHYKATLVATNRAGLRFGARLSTPFLFDPDGPGRGHIIVCDASGEEIRFQNDTASLRLCFSGFVPSRSGMLAHSVELSWTDGSGGAVLLHREVPSSAPVAAVLLEALDLPCATQIIVKSRGLSKARVAGPTLTTHVTIDCTATSILGCTRWSLVRTTWQLSARPLAVQRHRECRG